MTAHVDPKVLELTAVAAKPIVERAIKKIGERVEETEMGLSKYFEITDREIRIHCPERSQSYSATIDVKRVPLIKRKINLKHGRIRRASIRPIRSLRRIDAIQINDDGFTLDLGMLLAGETYAMEIDYTLEDSEFLDSIVDRSTPRETPTAPEQFWMVASLKHLDVLKSNYGTVDLYDLDFSVDVNITKDLETKIPKVFKQQIQQLIRVAGPLGRDELFREYYKLRQLKTKPYGKDALEKYQEIMDLFSPPKFKSFVEVKDDFHYFSCERGLSEYTLAFLSYPKSMVITSRADLTLDRPIARGKLVYKSSSFQDEIEKILSKK